MMKLTLMRIATGKDDPELPLLQWISSLELPASESAAQINQSAILQKWIQPVSILFFYRYFLLFIAVYIHNRRLHGYMVIVPALHMAL